MRSSQPTAGVPVAFLSLSLTFWPSPTRACHFCSPLSTPRRDSQQKNARAGAALDSTRSAIVNEKSGAGYSGWFTVWKMTQNPVKRWRLARTERSPGPHYPPYASPVWQCLRCMRNLPAHKIGRQVNGGWEPPSRPTLLADYQPNYAGRTAKAKTNRQGEMQLTARDACWARGAQ